MLKKCAYCGREFYADNKKRVYCCEECRKKGKKKKAKERFQAEYGKYAKPKEEKTAPKNSLTEIAVKARKLGYKSYGYYVGLTEYPVKIERKW